MLTIAAVIVAGLALGLSIYQHIILSQLTKAFKLSADATLEVAKALDGHVRS